MVIDVITLSALHWNKAPCLGKFSSNNGHKWNIILLHLEIRLVWIKASVIPTILQNMYISQILVKMKDEYCVIMFFLNNSQREMSVKEHSLHSHPVGLPCRIKDFYVQIGNQQILHKTLCAAPNRESTDTLDCSPGALVATLVLTRFMQSEDKNHWLRIFS